MIKGAVLGAFLGQFRLGETSYRPLMDFERLPAEGNMPPVFDIWPYWAEHLANGLSPETICESRLKAPRINSVEALFGDHNLRLGFRPPLSGSFRHPLAVSATIWPRCLFWGLALPAHEAARHAYWDAESDQASESALIAATLAANVMADSPMDWLRRMLGLLERVPSARAILRLVADGVVRGESAASLAALIRSEAETSDAYGAVTNLGFLAAALVMGAGDFKRTLLTAASAGGEAVATATFAGAMAARWYGLPDDWSEHLQGVQIANQDLDAFLSRLGPEEPPLLPDAVSEPVELPTLTSSVSAHGRGDLVVSITYEDLPVAFPNQTLRCIVQFENRGAEKQVQPSVTAPEGWVVAHRLAPFRLPAEGRASFPLVIQPSMIGGAAELRWEGGESVPLLALTPQRWYVCGPFSNADEMGFHKSYRAEDVLKLGEVFAGRGDGGIQWRERSFAGVVLDPEPYFMGGAGVVYLYAQVEFAEPGTYTLVAAGSPGVIVQVNRQPVVRYQADHRPTARPMAPYVGTFEANGRTDVLVKLIRAQSPVSPLTLYFLDRHGQVVDPVAWHAMPR